MSERSSRAFALRTADSSIRMSIASSADVQITTKIHEDNAELASWPIFV
jgi:hypothetical protein